MTRNVTWEPDRQLKAMLKQVELKVGLADVTGADARYFSERAIVSCESKGGEFLVAQAD